jgi:hypothetical protein
MITNPVTQAYLESAMTVQSLFGQAGGADVVSAMDIEGNERYGKGMNFNVGDTFGNTSKSDLGAMEGVEGQTSREGQTPRGRPIPERISKVLGAKRKEDEIDMQPRTKRFQSRPIMNPGELPYEDMTLLLTVKKPEEEYNEAFKLFMDVEYLLNQRYSEAGTIPLFLRIINGYDEDNVVYYDEALKEDERVLNEFNIKSTPFFSTREFTLEGIDLKYAGEDFLRELGFGIGEETAQIRKRTRKRRKKKDTESKRPKKKDTTRKKAGQTKMRKRRKTVKKDSLYQRLLKRLGY